MHSIRHFHPYPAITSLLHKMGKLPSDAQKPENPQCDRDVRDRAFRRHPWASVEFVIHHGNNALKNAIQQDIRLAVPIYINNRNGTRGERLSDGGWERA